MQASKTGNGKHHSNTKTEDKPENQNKSGTTESEGATQA